MSVQTPDEIAQRIVDRFSWSSNVMRDGRLVGQQFIVAEAIAKAIEAEREELAAAVGYMMNAKIDLETNTRKKTAINTLEGGIRRLNAVLRRS